MVPAAALVVVGLLPLLALAVVAAAAVALHRGICQLSSSVQRKPSPLVLAGLVA